jgi:phosphate transport system permease protein
VSVGAGAVGKGAAGLPTPAGSAEAARRTSIVRRAADALRHNESGVWRWGARVGALLPLAALVFAVTVLAVKAWPAITVNGWKFLTHSGWNLGSTYGATTTTNGVAHPLHASYGAWPLIAGTLQTSCIALILALPISIAGAFALTERLPGWISRPLGMAIEVLAGIPSVVIGLWGVFTLGPLLAQHVYPIIANNMPDVPVLSYFRGPVGHGEGLLTSGIVLALMIIPIITSTTRDLFMQVPPLPKEGGEALGMTEEEVARKITIPWVRTGILGATVLGLGRAMGETIAVAMISGAAIGTVAPNIYGTMTTIAATIVTQLDSSATDATGFATSTLAEAALVLAVISLAVNVAARLIVTRTGRHAAPVGQVA